MKVRARHYALGTVVDLDCVEGKIQCLNPVQADAADTNADLVGSWVAPAWCDVQINGCLGQSFNSPNLTESGIEKVIETCQAHGIGQLCPTLVTGSFEALAHGFRTLSRACRTSARVGRAVVGFHLEGPYISPEDGPRGAHPREHVRPPSWDEFQRWQEAADGQIRMVTLAPEQPGAVAFIAKLAAEGVVVALGHSGATGEQIRAAVQAGARVSTHLGNGSHAVLPRHDNYLWEQLADDRLWASFISDGHHLPAAILKAMLRAKGPTRALLTCDASSLAGLPAGVYTEWGQNFEILPTGRVVVPGTSYLAGSGVFTDTCVGHAASVGGLSLTEAVELATLQPRRLLGLPEQRLAAGEPADLVLFRWEPGQALQVEATVLAGAVVSR